MAGFDAALVTATAILAITAITAITVGLVMPRHPPADHDPAPTRDER